MRKEIFIRLAEEEDSEERKSSKTVVSKKKIYVMKFSRGLLSNVITYFRELKKGVYGENYWTWEL